MLLKMAGDGPMLVRMLWSSHSLWVMALLAYINVTSQMLPASAEGLRNCNPNEPDVCLNSISQQDKNIILYQCGCPSLHYTNRAKPCEQNLSENYLLLTISTDAVNMSWIENRNDLTSYQVYWNGNQCNDSTDCFNSLGQGTQYNLSVTNSRDSQRNNSYQCSVWTVPAKPGPVHEVKLLSELLSSTSEHLYQISFGHSEGKVSSYTIAINGTNYLTDGSNPSFNNVTLIPGNIYTYNLTAYNGANVSSETTTATLAPEAAAKDVRNITMSSQREENYRSIRLNISWTPGLYTGQTNYSINITEGMDVFIDLVSGYNTTTYSRENVSGYCNYTVHIQAHTITGSSAWVSETHVTVENNPGVVQNVIVRQDGNKAQQLTVTFDCLQEKQRNGILTGYLIQQTLVNAAVHGVHSYSHSVSPESCNSTYVWNQTEVDNTNYSFAVMAMNNKFNGSFSKVTFLILEPRKPRLAEMCDDDPKLVSIDLKKERSKFKVTVKTTNLLNPSQGKVLDAGLIVCVKGRERDCNVTAEDYKSVFPYNEIKGSNLPDLFRITPMNWIDILKPETTNTFIVGYSASCNPVDDMKCIWKLVAGKTIVMSLILCTKAGCDQVILNSNVKIKDLVTKPSEANYTVVNIVLVLVAIAALFCFTVFFIYYKKAPHKIPCLREEYRPEQPEICLNRPVKIRQFEEHVKKLHKDSNLLFQEEFECIINLCTTFQNSCNEAQREANRVKNRYVDILPYDHSRVKLDVQPEHDETNDFINANYIPGFNSVREYIATQGPMHCTVPDFWRMAWEQKCQIIVMLSDLQENGKLKVDQYWPESLNDPVQFDDVVVEMINSSQLSKYIIRNFRITKGEEIRKISQFLLPGWWDFSANLSFCDVLEFVKLVRQEIKPETSGPVIVHCSAGVGRTGTMIALDYFTQYVNMHSLDDDLDIYNYVLLMRKNRPRMVQAESQYIFIFDAVLEIIKRRMKCEEDRLLDSSASDQNGNLDHQTENMNVEIQLVNETCLYNNKPDNSDVSTLETAKPLTTELRPTSVGLTTELLTTEPPTPELWPTSLGLTAEPPITEPPITEPSTTEPPTTEL